MADKGKRTTFRGDQKLVATWISLKDWKRLRWLAYKRTTSVSDLVKTAIEKMARGVAMPEEDTTP